MSRHESEIPTPWGARVLLLAQAVACTFLTYGLRHMWFVWPAAAGSIFCWLCVITCWKTIIVGEPEWHDYR